MPGLASAALRSAFSDSVGDGGSVQLIGCKFSTQTKSLLKLSLDDDEHKSTESLCVASGSGSDSALPLPTSEAEMAEVAGSGRNGTHENKHYPIL